MSCLLRRVLRLSFYGLAAAATFMAGCTLGSGPIPCQAQINNVLAQSFIRKEEVSSIRASRSGAGRRSTRNETVDAWVRLRSCNGHLVIAMRQSCHVQQVYTLGDCQVAGVRRF